jgi:hypothetical protein
MAALSNAASIAIRASGEETRQPIHNIKLDGQRIPASTTMTIAA